MDRKVSVIENVDEANVNLTTKQKGLYAIGDFGNNFSWTFVSSFLLYFWTDVLGIASGIGGLLIGISRIWDALNDPLVGRWSDRTNTRWGRYRPWILFSSIPLAILNILCFTNLGIQNETVKVVVAALFFFVLVFVYTCVNVPYSAMSASLTLNDSERGSLATYRLFFAYCAAMIITYGTQRLVAVFGGTNVSRGFMLVAVAYSVLMVVCHMICFKGTKEIVKAPIEKVSYADSFRALKGNRPVLILALAFLVYGVFNYGRSGVALYYFQYKMNNPLYYSTYSLIGIIAAITGIVLVPRLAKRMSNKAHVVMLSFLIGGLGCIACFFFNNILLIYIVTAISGLGFGAGAAMIYGMVPDTTEYTQSRYGMRASGFISVFVNFWLKVGMAIAITGVGTLMDLTGYIANQAQSSSTLLAINVMFTLVPGILALICVFVLKFYKLDKKTYQEVLNSLKS